MVRAGCVFVASIHPSRTWTSGSLESVQWNACVHRLDLSLYSHPKEFWGMEFEPMFDSKGKIPSTGKFPQRRIEPATLWTASPDDDNDNNNDCIERCNWVFSYNLLTALWTVFNAYALVARAQACAKYVQHIEHLSLAISPVPRGVEGQLSY